MAGITGINHRNGRLQAAIQARVAGVADADGGVGEVPLLGIQGVVEDEGAFDRRVVDVVGLHGGYVGVGSQAVHELLGLLLVQLLGGLDNCVVGGGGADNPAAGFEGSRGGIDGLLDAAVQVTGGYSSGHLGISATLLGSLLCIVGVGDDELVKLLLGKGTGSGTSRSTLGRSRAGGNAKGGSGSGSFGLVGLSGILVGRLRKGCRKVAAEDEGACGQ